MVIEELAVGSWQLAVGQFWIGKFIKIKKLKIVVAICKLPTANF
jgi:hypothetical protein